MLTCPDYGRRLPEGISTPVRARRRARYLAVRPKSRRPDDQRSCDNGVPLLVRGSDPNGIVVIAQLAPIGVLFTVPQDSLPALMKRTRADERLPVEAWDREQKTRLAQGRLVAVDNLVDVGYLVRTGEEAFRITVEGINEVQRRPQL